MTLAHVRDDGTEQSLREHLSHTAQLAKEFADTFSMGNLAYLMGLVHDIGKYSGAFQKRIRGENTHTVDHSTAGGQLLYKLLGPVPAYGVMGHHSGLMNGGSGAVSSGELLSSELFSRLKRVTEDYSAYQNEIALPTYIQETLPVSAEDTGFSMALLTRMLYSALVDADFLDTEDFMNGHYVKRGGYEDTETLYERYLRYTRKFAQPIKSLDEKRNEIYQDCMKMAAAAPGLYSLTVPTGGGKTISSLGFALKHAKKHGMRRIIYVIPYTSIIEQNAAVIGSIVGAGNVLEHHSSISYDGDNDTENLKRLSAENWDAPVVVTTNVQFFESLFACRSSKCRKLHNIANSVIIFDEAQMLPLPYLIPCVKTITELVKHYKSTAVLCTATQPALHQFFPKTLQPVEICSDPGTLYEFFRRVTLQNAGKLSDEELAERLNAQEQILCIVNSRKQAQAIYKKLSGGYHLSTLMTPEHRKRVIAAIREDLANGRPCRVVSTSLVEAGVDFDFPVVYRAKAGLDSVIQAAGRCNREGRRATTDSFVYVFEADDRYNLPQMLLQPAAGYDIISKEYSDIGEPEAIHRYFDWLYTVKQHTALDKLNLISRFNDGWSKNGGSFPFRDTAEAFHLIDQNTFSILIPLDDEAKALEQRITAGERSRPLLRAVSRHSVNIYENHLNLLLQNGQVEFMDTEASQKTKDGIFILRGTEGIYDKNTGLELEPETGFGLFT